MPSQPLGFLPVFKRETLQYLHSPGTYVALAFFFLLSGAFFTGIMRDFADLSTQVSQGEPIPEGELPLNVTLRVISQMFSLMSFLMLLLTPMLTMRLLAEEKKSGSFELLVTTPLGNWDILLGKYFAALAVGWAVLLVTVAYPALCAIYSAPEPAVIVSCYVGLALIVAAYTAFGVFASSLTDSQITAAVLSFVGLLLFQMVHFLFKSGQLGQIAAGLSIHQRAEGFTKGLIASPDIAYFLLFTLFFLFMSAQTLDARRGRVGN